MPFSRRNILLYERDRHRAGTDNRVLEGLQRSEFKQSKCAESFPVSRSEFRRAAHQLTVAKHADCGRIRSNHDSDRRSLPERDVSSLRRAHRRMDVV